MEGVQCDFFVRDRLTQANLRSHRAKINSYESSIHKWTNWDCQAISLTHKASIVNYRVDIGMLSFSLILLNLKDGMQDHKGLISKGGFGEIYERNIATGKFISKVQNKAIKSLEINEVLVEVVIHKLCSLYGIGPAIETAIPFDLVVYDNAIEFFMEKCDSWQMALKDQRGDLERDLKEGLLMLHRLGVAHKDIKPENVLWSPCMNRYVFCDFGISVPLRCNPGERQITSPSGTYEYMSSQMKEMKRKKGLADLRYNDIFALGITIKKITEVQHGFNEVPPHYQKLIPSPFEDISANDFAQDSQSQIRGSFEQDKLQSSLLSSQDSHTHLLKSKERSYEFFRMLFAATSLKQHNFDLQVNVPYLSERQAGEIQNILANCHSEEKMKAFLREVKELGEKPKWIQELALVFDENLKNAGQLYSPLPVVTQQIIKYCLRVFHLKSKSHLASLWLKISQPGFKEEESLQELRIILTTYVSTPHFEDKEDQQSFKRLCNELCPKGTDDDNILYKAMVGMSPEALSRQFKEYAIHDILNVSNGKTSEGLLFLKQIQGVMMQQEESQQSLCEYLQNNNPGLLRRLLLLILLFTHYLEPLEELLRICERTIRQVAENKLSFLSELVFLQRCLIQNHYPRRYSPADMLRAVEDHIGLISGPYEPINIYLMDMLLSDRLGLLHQIGKKDQIQQATLRLAEHSLRYELMLESSYLQYVFRRRRDRAKSETELLQEIQMVCEKRNASLQFQAAHIKYHACVKKGELRQATTSLLQMESLAANRQQEFWAKYSRADFMLRTGLIELAYATVSEAQKIYESLVLKEINRGEQWGLYETKFNCQKLLGRYNDALESCKKLNECIEGSESNANLKRGMVACFQGICRIRLGDLDGALERQLAAESLYLKQTAIPYSLVADVYREITGVYINKQMPERAREYSFRMLEWEKQGNLCRPEAANVHYTIALSYTLEMRDEEAAHHYWTCLEWKSLLQGDFVYKSFTAIYQQNRKGTQRQILSLASYALNKTSKPNPNQADFIAKEFYLRPIPTGRLPYHLPTSSFIEQAESRFSDFSPQRNIACYYLKLRLLPVLATKIQNEPIYALFLVRTNLEAHLHLFLSAKSRVEKCFLLMGFMPWMMKRMQDTAVAEQYEQEKQQLLRYAETLVARLQQ